MAFKQSGVRPFNSFFVHLRTLQNVGLEPAWVNGGFWVGAALSIKLNNTSIADNICDIKSRK